ncbi:Tol-Pal system peptidoglycan-associated lipoprotein PAL [hydrothermal vent metagenome]|uniref:Tol-Pal system peptidoglycan-associated lipoprotein PAL n=1 Tax=hydrothermal vent metagenome TaxID=652676 RepID=A0A3B0V2I0_9ZZZZ
MKLINKLTILILICSVIVSCKKKPPQPETHETNNDSTQVVDTDVQTNPLTNAYQYQGQTFYDICCDADDLDNPQSLLSQRVILFAYDQATVESQYRDVIAIHARYLSANPSAKMVLEGHADERGTPAYNLALGEKRGNSVMSLLRAQGASAGQLSVVSFGEEKPVALCNDESCWSQNRRVRIVYTAK